MDRNTGGQWFTFHLESERPRGGPKKATLRMIDNRCYLRCGTTPEGLDIHFEADDFWAGVEHIKEHYKPAIIFARSHLYNRLCREWGEREGIITKQC